MIDVGSRWFFYGLERTVEERALRPQNGPGWFVRLSPVHGRGRHWTDWVLEKALANRGTPLGDGGAPVEAAPGPAKPITQKAAAAAAVEKVREGSTAKAQLAKLRKRLWNINNKIDHPEKHGTTKWTKPELAEMHEKRSALEAEISALQ